MSALAAVVVLVGCGASFAMEAIRLPESARPMTGVELYVLYRGKTWQWPDGAGYLQDEGRVFKAWSGSAAEASWAEGRWIVTDAGLLCFQADWHSQSGTFDDRTCFSHRIADGTIFQKREPAGDWHVFKHPEPKDGDEFNKLVGEDLVSHRLQRLRNPARQSAMQGAQHAER